MSATSALESPVILALGTETAADLMTPNPVSIQEDAPLSELLALLSERGPGAAPVIDEAGHPVGVATHADLVIHERERRRAGLGESNADPSRVRDIMTPAVFSVSPQVSVAKVVEEMQALGVHRLFVVDGNGVLVGTISALDVLRHLHPLSETM
jgi:CBS domain-containing protein